MSSGYPLAASDSQDHAGRLGACHPRQRAKALSDARRENASTESLGACAPSSAVAYERRRAIEWRMMREVCICETPMRRPIAFWVSSSSKRRRSTSRSRGVTGAQQFGRAWRGPRPARSPARWGRGRAGSVSAASSSVPRGGSEATWRGTRRAAGARRARCSAVAGRARAISATVGWRCRSLGQLGDALSTRSASSCRPRGTRRPRAVAEVAPDFAQDGRHGVAGERDVAAEVEAIDRLDEPQTGDLEEIVEGLPVRW